MVTTAVIGGAAAGAAFLAGQFGGEGGDADSTRRRFGSSLTSERGSRVPYVIGRRMVGRDGGPVVLWRGSRRWDTEGGDGGGGLSGLGGGGGGETETDVVREGGWFGVCLGPSYKLYAIRKSGRRVWGQTLDADGTNSGDTLSLSDGSFVRWHWGERDQPVQKFLAGETGVDSRWPYLCHAVFQRAYLGSTPTWEPYTFDIECRMDEVSDSAIRGLVLSGSGYWLNDSGDQGVNAAHVLAQLWTCPRPWGAGMSVDRIDVDALEAFGVVCESEHLALNLMIEGQTVDEVTGWVLADCGAVLVQVGDRLRVEAVRKAATVPVLDRWRDLSEQPRIEFGGTSGVVRRRRFAWSDEARRFTRNLVEGPPQFDPFDVRNGERAELVEVRTATSRRVARKVAGRRLGEGGGGVGGEVSVLSLDVLGGFRKLVAGQSLDTAWGRARVMESRLAGEALAKPPSGGRLEVMIDPYEVTEVDPTVEELTGEADGSAVGDLAVLVLELGSAFVGDGPAALGVLRGRGSSAMRGAGVWVSGDPGSGPGAYALAGRQDAVGVPAVLLEDFDFASGGAGGGSIAAGPLVEPLNDDAALLLDLSGDASQLEGGRQVFGVRLNGSTHGEADGGVGYVERLVVQAESAWAPGAYVVGDVVAPTVATGLRYEVTVGGVAGATEPEWPVVVGETVTLDGVTYVARRFAYRMTELRTGKAGTRPAMALAGDVVVVADRTRLAAIRHPSVARGVSVCVKTLPDAPGVEGLALASQPAACVSVVGVNEPELDVLGLTDGDTFAFADGDTMEVVTYP